MTKAKREVNDELHGRPNTKEGEVDLYHLVIQTDPDGKDAQQIGVIKDKDLFPVELLSQHQLQANNNNMSAIGEK